MHMGRLNERRDWVFFDWNEIVSKFKDDVDLCVLDLKNGFNRIV